MALLQLPRRAGEYGLVCNAHTHTYLLQDILHLPVFLSPHSDDIRWAPYFWIALIIHHGASLEAGHYTVMARNGDRKLVLDDAKTAALARNQEMDHASCNMYLVLFLSCRHAPFQDSFSAQASVSHGEHTLTPAGKRRSQDPGPAELARMHTEGSRSSDGHHEIIDDRQFV